MSVYQPIDLKIKDNTVVQPDISVVCKPILLSYLDFPPLVVFEILTTSTALKDKHTQFGLYEEFGIRYYFMVDPELNTIQHFELAHEGYV